MLSGLTFLLNLLTLVSIYLEKQVFAQYLFGCAVIIMMLSILLYLMEISTTVRAVGLILNKIKFETIITRVYLNKMFLIP